MSILEVFGAVIGIPVAIFGLIGGWITLANQVEEYRTSRRPHGKRSVTSLVIYRDDLPDFTEVEFLFIGDVIKWMVPLTGMHGRIVHFEKVGEYYRVRMHFPPGQDLRHTFIKTN